MTTSTDTLIALTDEQEQFLIDYVDGMVAMAVSFGERANERAKASHDGPRTELAPDEKAAWDRARVSARETSRRNLLDQMRPTVAGFTSERIAELRLNMPGPDVE